MSQQATARRVPSSPPRPRRATPRLPRLGPIALLLTALVVALSAGGCAVAEEPAAVSTSPEIAEAAAKAPRVITRLDGSTIEPDALTDEIEPLLAAADVHGITVSVFDQGAAVYSRAFGWADQPNERPLRTDTEMYGASISKAVFAVLVMKLVDQGVLDLDTPLVDLVDEPLASVHGEEWHQDFTALASDPRHRTITARMALAHTTGLPNWRWFEDDQEPHIHFAPGSRFGYSGEGMVFLQAALEMLTGTPLEQLMQQELFEPLGMETSSYTWQPEFERDYAVGHREDGTTFPKDKDNAPRAPSTLETTTDDLVRFVEAVLQGRILSDEARSEMFAPQIPIRFETQFGPGASIETDRWDDIELAYALGWGRFETPHGPALFKEGHGDGFEHYLVVFPETGQGVMLLGNSANAESAFHHLLIATMADPYTPLEWEGPGYVPFDRVAPESDDGG